MNVHIDDLPVVGTEPSPSITGRLNADFEMADVEVTKIAEAMRTDDTNSDIQYFSGKLGVRGRLDVPLDKLSDERSYGFRGTVDLTEFRWPRGYAQEIRLPLEFTDGTVVSENFSVQFDAQARASGKARIEYRLRDRSCSTNAACSRVLMPF